MLYYLLFRLRDVFVGFNVFRYITFRTAFAALTAERGCPADPNIAQRNK